MLRYYITRMEMVVIYLRATKVQKLMGGAKTVLGWGLLLRFSKNSYIGERGQHNVLAAY